MRSRALPIFMLALLLLVVATALVGCGGGGGYDQASTRDLP